MPLNTIVSGRVKRLLVAGCVGLILFSAAAHFYFQGQQAAIEAILETVPGGVIVLDNCDPQYDGKSAYEDNLTFLNAAGKITARISNLNVCEEIGGPNRIAVDPERGRVWVAELVTSRLLLFTLEGRQLLNIPGGDGSTVAVDPETGNLWVACGSTIGKGSIAVYDDQGTLIGYNRPLSFSLDLVACSVVPSWGMMVGDIEGGLIETHGGS